MNDLTHHQNEIQAFFKLSSDAAVLMQTNPAETAATVEAVELRDEIDLAVLLSEGVAIRAQAARLLERFDAWQLAAH